MKLKELLNQNVSKPVWFWLLIGFAILVVVGAVFDRDGILVLGVIGWIGVFVWYTQDEKEQ